MVQLEGGGRWIRIEGLVVGPLVLVLVLGVVARREWE